MVTGLLKGISGDGQYLDSDGFEYHAWPMHIHR